MINKSENEDLVGNLECKFLHWRRHAIGDCLPNSLCMNDVTLEYLSVILQQKICVLFKLNREKHFLGSIYYSTDAGKVKRAPLFFKNDEFYWNPNKTDLEYRVKCPVDEWINNG